MTWPNIRNVWYFVTSVRGILTDGNDGNHVALPAIFFSQLTLRKRTLNLERLPTPSQPLNSLEFTWSTSKSDGLKPAKPSNYFRRRISAYNYE